MDCRYRSTTESNSSRTQQLNTRRPDMQADGQAEIEVGATTENNSSHIQQLNTRRPHMQADGQTVHGVVARHDSRANLQVSVPLSLSEGFALTLAPAANTV